MEVKDLRMAQGAETQRALRRQARKLFAQKGYSGANTNELVERARVTKGALYHHFANKKELYQAVVEDMEQELVERIEAAGAGRAPWERLSAMCSAYVDACREPALARMLVLEAPAVLGWKTWCNLEQRYEVAAFARCLKEIDGLNEPAETLAQVILGALTTGARVIATAPDPEAARTEVQQTIDRLICGLRSTAR
ncbi:MAG TPA: TetR/AcrR family transcriptional regulator [Burkholderiales bacterium]|nr:TetR/AcrR family transcriptional regulator [Burkholderiales bacterium]